MTQGASWVSDVRDPREQLAQRHVPRLLVDLARQRAPFRILAKVRLGRHGGPDPRLDNLFRASSQTLLIRRDEGLDAASCVSARKPLSTSSSLTIASEAHFA